MLCVCDSTLSIVGGCVTSHDSSLKYDWCESGLNGEWSEDMISRLK